MKSLVLSLTFITVSFSAFATDKVKGTNYLVVIDRQLVETGEGTGYWMSQSKGIQRLLDGPRDPEPVECKGAGYWNKDGDWGEGVCVYGSGENMRVSSWKQARGTGEWELLSGTGIYEGVTGQGTYVSTSLPGGRSISEFEGEVTMAK